MAAPTSFISTEATAENAYTTTYAPLKTYEKEGRLRLATFSFANASQAAGYYGLCVLPKGAKIVQIAMVSSVTHGTTVTVKLGLAGRDGSGYIDTANSVADDDDGLRQATVTAGGTTLLTLYPDGTAANIGALGMDYVTEKEVWLTMTTAAATLAATGVTKGRVFYVVD